MAEIPKEGFLKIVAPPRAAIDSSQKAALIRKGNQLYNDGDIATAKKIFLTVRYTDGITRIGDYYYNKNEYWEAYRLYRLAPASDKADHLARRMAEVIREWLNQ